MKTSICNRGRRERKVNGKFRFWHVFLGGGVSSAYIFFNQYKRNDCQREEYNWYESYNDITDDPEVGPI